MNATTKPMSTSTYSKTERKRKHSRINQIHRQKVCMKASWFFARVKPCMNIRSSPYADTLLSFDCCTRHLVFHEPTVSCFH